MSEARAMYRLKCAGRFLERAAGFTLLELLLVLALIGLTLAWAAPAWKRQLAARRLQAATEELRSHWQEARLRAIDAGNALVFEFMPGTGRYRVRPLPNEIVGSPEWASVPVGVAQSAPGTEPIGDVEWSMQSVLPDGIVIAALGGPHGSSTHVVVYSDERSAEEVSSALEEALNAVPSDSSDVPAQTDRPNGYSAPDWVAGEAEVERDGPTWFPCATFLPGGRTSDTRLLIASPQLQLVRQLTMRGLTGRVTISDVAWPESLNENE